MDDIYKAIESELDIIKGKRKAGLTQRTVIDKNGQVRRVWVRTEKKLESKKKQTADKVLRDIDNLLQTANQSSIGSELKEELVSKINVERGKWSKMVQDKSLIDDMLWQRKAVKAGYKIEEGSRAGVYNLRKLGSQAPERGLTESEVKQKISA